MAAADLVCGFGMQDKHPPLDLMSSFLIKTNTDANEERREGHTSLRSLVRILPKVLFCEIG